jgi:hypothetical protein
MAGAGRHRFRRLLAASPLLLTAALLAITLRANPFAAPFVEAAAADAARQLQVALAREVTPDRMAAEIAAALRRDDIDGARRLADLAQRHGVPLPPDAVAELAGREAADGWWDDAGDCAECAWDVAACPRLDLLPACGIGVELTVLGDLNALRRAALAALVGQEVDRLEVALALVGVTATVAALPTGGTALAVKWGATLLRLARRLDRLTPGLLADLGRHADIGLRPDRLAAWAFGRAAPEEVADLGRLSRLGAAAADLGRIADNTSLVDAIHLLGEAEDLADLGRIARVSEALGPETRPAFALLGKGRVFRALLRLSDLALAAIALLWALALQVMLLLASLCGRVLLRVLRRAA